MALSLSNSHCISATQADDVANDSRSKGTPDLDSGETPGLSSMLVLIGWAQVACRMWFTMSCTADTHS